jgi:outer membrane protein assembly factor BamA
MEGQVSLNHTRDFREAYDSIENELRASLERRFRTAFSLRINYRYQGTKLTRVSPEAETPSVTSIDAIGPSLRYDNTDDPFLPRNGWRVLGSVEEGMKIFENDVGFHKSEGRLGRFDTSESGWTFFEGFQIGLILPHSGDKVDVIPINERFFLGGANSVRGYSERSLGPKDAAGAPLGGTFFVVTNLELRHRIYKRVFGVMFFDMGNLFDYDPGATDPKVNLNSINDLAQSCGAGIRFHSPVGAIRLEGGYQLNPEGGSATKFADRTALHFSIGEVF